jgi:hypothetical protein
MKTPREILMSHHRSAEPKLDSIRSLVAAKELREQKAGTPGWYLPALLLWVPNRFWRELILPSRRIWTGLAAVWLLLAIINISQSDGVSSVTGKPVRSPAVMMSWQAQQRLMNELIADRVTSPEADRPQNVTPRPRTEDCEIRSV